ncbi:MAG: hypothetical protein IPK26_26690 [Planctomycetes bacterium]|nr:hypothetical protein [Planctomycetota bacterium]
MVAVPGPYSVYYGYEGGACMRVDVDAQPGANELDLVSVPGVELELVFDYRHVVVREAMTMLDLVVCGPGGSTVWRERVHAPIAEDGTARIRRSFRDPNGVIQAFDRRGGRAAVSMTPQPGPQRILLR